MRSFRCAAALLVVMAAMATGAARADAQYEEAMKYAQGLKGKGMDTLKGTDPAKVVPNYNPNPDEAGYYGGTTATSNPDVINDGNAAMNSSEAGKTLQDLVKNRPPDRISTDAPFISSALDTEAQAEVITQGVDTQCQAVDVNKTQITNYTCERTPAVDLSCTRTATAGGGHEVETTTTKTFTINNSDFIYSYTGGDQVGIQFRAPATGTVISASLSAYFENKEWSYQLDWWGLNTGAKGGNRTWTLPGAPGTMLTEGAFGPQGMIVHKKCMGGTHSHCSFYAESTYMWLLRGEHARMTLTLTMQVTEKTWAPDVVWTENCPFDKSEQVKTGSVCTDPGGDRTFTIGGKTYTLHSDCWQYTDTYVSQEADNGTCSTYMNNSACTVARTTCQESLNGTCLREQAVFSCEETAAGSAQLCGGQLVCADGSCDHIEHSNVNDFQAAVSGLAALAAAGEDVAALNGVNVSAFTGKSISCRKAMAGFSNCCKDSGWGQSAGLASCNSEEKALGEAKSRKLTIYVGSYCAHKVLGVCTEKKEGYCQFDSKLAKIVQEQGRRGQLGIGFGSGKSPDCRGLTVDEMQRLNFDAINFADFYDDLENGTTIPADQELIDSIEAQVAGKMEDMQ